MRNLVYLVSLLSVIGLFPSCQDHRDTPVNPQRQERNAIEPGMPGPSNPTGR
jgi:hypothetical protein